MTGTLADAAARSKPLNEQLWLLLDHIAADLPGCMGVSLTVGQQGGPLSVLATHGVAEHLAAAQLRRGGPITVAATTCEPVTTSDLFADDRWPALSRDELIGRQPELAERFHRVHGAVALPSTWNERNILVLAASLDRPADQATVAVLSRYERLTALTLTVAEASATDAMDQVLSVFAARAVIEQAKGAIVAVRRCSAEEAWETLRRTSQQFNVKVRELAVALIEHLAHPQRPSSGGTASASARQAAQLLWAAFTAKPAPGRDQTAGLARPYREPRFEH